MAPPNLSFSGPLITQLLFGLFLMLVFLSTGYDLSLSLFLGVLGSLALGWVTTVSTNSSKPETVASNEGIDAGLKYWLFFLLGFVCVGYRPPMSIFLGAIAGIGGGLIIAWWKSQEETRTQLQSEVSEDSEAEFKSDRVTRQQKRRATRRYRRTPGSINFRFWEK